VDVVRLRWPAERDQVEANRRLGVPRLLVLDDGEPPPSAPDCLEDWVRVNTPADDVELRARAIATRAARHGAHPTLDGDGLLRFHDSWVSLSPVEQALASALVERFGTVVGRDALAGRAWPAGVPTRNALDVHVLRLRRRIAPLGLEIRTVRSRGYLLQPASEELAISS
jgi:DNA-binding winged helix-turn-helix (wHTH) protein